MRKLLIGRVAEAAGVSRDTVDNAEKRGWISSERDVNGWRLYSPEAVEQLCAIYGRKVPKDLLR